jgi:hypothetical protein
MSQINPHPASRAELVSIGVDPRGASEFGRTVAAICSIFAGGLHNWTPVSSAKKADWSNQHCIEIVWGGTLSTFDYSNLTALVILAHDYAVRIELKAVAPNYMRLLFHPRKRRGDIFERHPTIEQAVETLRRRSLEPQP